MVRKKKKKVKKNSRSTYVGRYMFRVISDDPFYVCMYVCIPKLTSISVSTNNSVTLFVTFNKDVYLRLHTCIHEKYVLKILKV
jgi:hypothetical protein